MANPTINDQINSYLREMSKEDQQRILDFVRSILSSKHRGIPGSEFVKNLPRIPAEDLEEMKRAIEEHCERIDENGW